METRPTVFVVDDDERTRLDLKQMLEGARLSVEEYSSADRFLERRFDDPNTVACLLLNLGIPGLGGLGLQERLNRAGVPIPIVFLSDLPEVSIIVHALQAGAIDYLQKPVQRQTLLPRVERALSIAAIWRENRVLRAEFQARLSDLTNQERRVYAFLLDGKNSKEIAAALNIGLPTVTRHRARVLQKLGVKNPVELAKLATRCTSDAALARPHVPPLPSDPAADRESNS